MIYFTKYFCTHCESEVKGQIEYPEHFVPSEVICMTCGRKLKGHRRVSTVDGKTHVWVEYR